MASSRMQELGSIIMKRRKQGTEDYGCDGQRVGMHDGCFMLPGHRHLYEHWYDGIHQPSTSGCRDHQLGG